MAIKTPASLTGTWTGYKCYVTYLALKLHFTSQSYDFFKYGGKTSASGSAYETRRDRYQFEKLARHPDPLGVMLAHISINPKSAWIGDMSPSSDAYIQFVKRNDALAYYFKEDLGRIKENLDDNLVVPSGTHPFLLSALIANKVSLETVCILQALYNFIPYWDDTIQDPIIWPENRNRIVKMLPFLEFDKAKMKEIAETNIDL